MNKYIYAFLCVLSFCYGDWNDDFDQNTKELLTQLINPRVAEYKKQYEVFQAIREKYLIDPILKSRLSVMTEEDKEVIFKPEEEIFLKKRRKDLMNETFVWEISTLMGIQSCIVPSFPMKIGGKIVVIQHREDLAVREKKSIFPAKSVLKSVSTESYWRAHLQAYLLGLGDLVGRNIGVNSKGKIRFFDTEGSFSYYNKPRVVEQGFCTGFYAHSLAWPHFEYKLSEQDVKALRMLISSWDDLEENMRIYSRYRLFPLNVEGMFYRLGKIREFALEKGQTFKDFYSFLFPRLGEGLEELRKIICDFTGRKVSCGEAIVLGRKIIRSLDVSEKEKKRMRDWIEAYIE
jgi:hypothetical protein